MFSVSRWLIQESGFAAAEEEGGSQGHAGRGYGERGGLGDDRVSLKETKCPHGVNRAHIADVARDIKNLGGNELGKYGTGTGHHTRDAGKQGRLIAGIVSAPSQHFKIIGLTRMALS